MCAHQHHERTNRTNRLITRPFTHTLCSKNQQTTTNKPKKHNSLLTVLYAQVDAAIKVEEHAERLQEELDELRGVKKEEGGGVASPIARMKRAVTRKEA